MESGIWNGIWNLEPGMESRTWNGIWNLESGIWNGIWNLESALLEFFNSRARHCARLPRIPNVSGTSPGKHEIDRVRRPRPERTSAKIPSNPRWFVNRDPRSRFLGRRARLDRDRLRSRGLLGFLLFLGLRVVAFSHRSHLDSSVRAGQRKTSLTHGMSFA